MIIALWIVQGLLALVFLLSGFMKGFTPLEGLKKNMTWVSATPPVLVRLLGIAEILGAIGLILPQLTGFAPWLTIAAAIGLLIVMVGAIVLHASRKETSGIGMTVVLFLLIAFVVVGHFAWVPLVS